jgi:hypothetical protein
VSPGHGLNAIATEGAALQCQLNDFTISSSRATTSTRPVSGVDVNDRANLANLAVDLSRAPQRERRLTLADT